MEIILIFIIGILGGYLGIKAKIPAGAMLGSLIAISIYNIIFGRVILPSYLKYIVQLCTGIFVGIKIKSSDIKNLKEVIKPALFIVASMIGFNLLIVFIMYKLTAINLATALFASSPGGLTNMLILAYEFDTDLSTVTSLQLVRFISILIILPNIIKYLSINNTTNETEKDNSIVVKHKFKKFMIAIAIGILGGIIGYFSELPAGILTVSMFFIAIYNIKREQLYMPNIYVRVVQIVAGILIGERITLNDVIRLKDIGPSAIILITGYILFTLVIGCIVNKFTKFNTATSYFSSAPGGLTDLTIMSDEIGADSHKIAVIHLFRLICVIVFYPILITWILK